MHVLDAAAALDPSPRAAYYGAPALPELARVGILDEVRRRGMVVDTLCWRRFRDHGYIAGLDGAVLADVDGQDLRTACLVLQELDRLMLDAFVDRYGGEVSWRHKVVEVGQDREGAWVEVEAAAEGGARKRLEADYVVGCDGANSAVRKSLFGNHFPGFTWDAQIIATNVRASYLDAFYLGT